MFTLSFLVLLALFACIFASELQVNVLKAVECDVKSANGDELVMHYTGSIAENSEAGNPGEVFDSSLSRNQPFRFTLGSGMVIQGWDQGLLDMCVGEKRELIIPPELGYGSRGAGGVIPGGATLKFEVELVQINPTEKEELPNIFASIDANSDGVITHEEMAYWFKNVHPQKFEQIPEGLFESEDANEDGVISWDEFSGPKGDAPPATATGEDEL